LKTSCVSDWSRRSETSLPAWRRVGELGLVEKYITLKLSGKPTFGELCAAYVKDGPLFRKKDGRRKSKGTIETYQYHIDDIILPRWRNDIAEEMKPEVGNPQPNQHCRAAGRGDGGAYFRVRRASLASCPLGRKQNFRRAGFPTWGDFEPYQDQSQQSSRPNV
jgi:hypothetical protein